MYNAMSTDAAQDVENILAAMVLAVADYVGLDEMVTAARR
jgi:hypothetical protein